MRPDNIEPLLQNGEPIVPSSGFAAAVTKAVEHVAAAPRAIQFPWLRCLPGLLATMFALALFALNAPSFPMPSMDKTRVWVAFGPVLSVLTLMLPLRLVRP